MAFVPKTRLIKGKQYIFCDWRRKFTRLTPEEWVRQNFLHQMVEDFHYPASRIAVEQEIHVGELTRRCDAVVYNMQLCPICLIEFKAPTVQLTQSVFDQAAVYNRTLGVHYFIISNLQTTYSCRVTPSGYEFLQDLPAYELLNY